MNKIKVIALSDLHGVLPPPKSIPECDLILIAGDICGAYHIFDQVKWLYAEFKPWLEQLPAKKIIGVAGNHDWIWEKSSHLVPKMNWEYLQDNFCMYEGWKVYGSPHQKRFFDWAFNLDEPDLERKWSYIPDDTDILVLHGPPKGHGDLTSRGEHVGSPSLTEKIMEISPKLVVFGHIHPGYGVSALGGSTLANVAILNDKYEWVNNPTEFILDPVKKKTTVKASLVDGTKISSKTIKWE